MLDDHDYERERRMIGRLETLDHMLHTLRNAIRTRASEGAVSRQIVAICYNLAALQEPMPDVTGCAGSLWLTLGEIQDKCTEALMEPAR